MRDPLVPIHIDTSFAIFSDFPRFSLRRVYTLLRLEKYSFDAFNLRGTNRHLVRHRNSRGVFHSDKIRIPESLETLAIYNRTVAANVVRNVALPSEANEGGLP